MRKRLIERSTCAKKGSLGYTLTELLTVIGIIAVLCAIAIPSVIAIRDSLRFARANNYAKSIFLAAQQNLTEMRSDGGLEPVQMADGAYSIPPEMTSFPNEFRTEYVYTYTGKDAFNCVLPVASVDATIRDDQIVIEYNPLTGNVYAVFYCDKNDLNLTEVYQNNLSRDKAERRNLMVGYYDGSGLNSSQIELEQTQAIVNFENGQEGIVQVIVPMPERFYGKHGDFASGLNITLGISGEQSMAAGSAKPSMELKIKTAADSNPGTLSDDGQSLIFEYSIDSLVNRSSFANYASNTQSSAPGEANSGASLTTVADESKFTYNILPGENITITATVSFEGTGSEMVKITPGILSGVNPMFEYLKPADSSGYVLGVSNGRNLQNLNAIAPTIAKQVVSVVFTSDIYWNDTVSYYNSNYAAGNTYYNTTKDNNGVDVYDEAPARALPYFVPIHNKELFGTASFEYGVASWVDKVPDGIIKDILRKLFESNSRVPTLTDEYDVAAHAAISGDDVVNGDAAQVYYLNIDTTKYPVGKAFYAGTATADKDRFTGLFSYVNTSIDNIHVVNPIVKGYKFTDGDTNNPATGAMVGAAGYNTYISNCAVYLDKYDPTFVADRMNTQSAYSANTSQTWYGVSGEGAVGGLVGYAKSHRTTTGELKADKSVLAFYNSFAAVNVSGNMRPEEYRGTVSLKAKYGYKNKDYGYSNGVGGLVGNSQLTNFYNCYASGNVIASNPNVARTYETSALSFIDTLMKLFGKEFEITYGGRESAGAGGFVGTSHGTRYTNCFSTGRVTATGSSSGLGAGGFAGIVCIDETFAYGNHNDSVLNYENIAQRTVITDCYSVGLVTLDGEKSESFSGANARNTTNLLSILNPSNISELTSALVADYYRLLAPHYYYAGYEPTYEDFYIFKDSYYLSQYYEDAEENSNSCAAPASYALLQNIPGYQTSASWISDQIDAVKDYKLGVTSLTSYERVYFNRSNKLEDVYTSAYKKGFSKGWGPATAAKTHGYDLNGTYPFSMLNGLEFYGDWPSLPLNMGIAYYEAYEKNSNNTLTRFYHFDRESTSELEDGNDVTVIKDGYAIMTSSNNAMTITVNGENSTFAKSKTSDTFSTSTNVYHVYWLTDAQMAAAQAYAKQSGQFYVPVTVTQDGKTQTFYFNPNVAKSQVNSAENHTYTASSNGVCSKCGNAADHELHLPINKEMLIRSARQFAQLSEMTNFLTSDYRYVQQLNIDAAKYLWTDAKNDIKVGSIGSADKAFNASYTGLYIDETTLEEKQYKLSGLQPIDAGLFGFIGQTGVVSDLIVECSNDIAAGAADTEDVAVLAGVTYGTIDNVDLNLTGNVTLTAKHCAALLAAHSTGKIVDCDVTVAADKAVTITAPNAGGLIGTAQGTADLKATLSNSRVTIGAFTAKNAAKIGGIVGNAIHLTADRMNATLASLTAETTAADSCVGGLAGYAEESAFNGVVSAVVNKETVNPVEITISGSMTATNGYAAAAIGSAVNTTLTAVDATSNGISGNIAAGYLGTGSNTDVSNSFVTVNGNMTGIAGAAGVAGTIGSQSVFQNVPVTLAGVEISASNGNAAGYALEIKGEADVYNSTVTLGTYETKTLDNKTTVMQPKRMTKITASMGDAAGYACVIDGSVGEDYVVGPAAISGTNAAGFAVTVNGAVAQSHVSPALTADAAGYLYNSNANLSVSGTNAASGFALTVGENGSINNSYTLCTIASQGTVEVKTEDGTSEAAEPTEPTDVTDPIDAQSQNVYAAYGFAGTNSGTINRCMANVDITGGFGFVGANNGLVTTSYGWYNDTDTTDPAAAITGTGRCDNSYFADMTPSSRKDLSVTVYDKDADATGMTAAQLQTTVIEGFSDSYRAMAYPYQEMAPAEYMYPMLRPHYGNWVTPPLYANGVAYYEIYEDNTFKIHMYDLSDTSVTEEGHANVTVSNSVDFDNTGKIVQAGYARFYNTEIGAQAGTKLDQLTYKVSYPAGEFTYDFYALEGEREVPIPKTTDKSSFALVDVRFADAVVVNADAFADTYVYQVRTPAQLANISQRTASYKQTHDITTSGVTSASIGSGCTYNGNGCTLTITNQDNTWLTSVGGTVTDLTLEVEGKVNEPVFGSVSGSGTVSLKSVTLGAVEANLISEVSGNVQVTLNDVTAGNVSANLIGTVSGGTVTTGPITMTSRTASIVGEFTGGTLQGGKDVKTAITVNGGKDPIANALFAETVGGTVRNYTVTAAGLTAKMVPTLSGTMENVALTINGDAGANVIDSLSGTAENIGVTINGNSTKSVIGSAGANAKLAGVTATVKTFSAAGTGGVLVATNNTSITDCTLNVGTATINNVENFGLIAQMLPGEKTMSGTTATVGTLTVNIDTDHNNVGGLVGLNNGTIQNSTVTANVEINGADGKQLTFGGLVGTNTGTIAVTKPSGVTVTYDQSNTTAATDKATIGGLVGSMTGGTLTGSGTASDVTGSISLAKDNSGTGRGYVVGGAVGSANSGQYSSVNASVDIATNWAESAYFGDVSGFDTTVICPAGLGPVGKFVGYIASGTFSTCSSDSKVGTYQFVGQINATKSSLISHADANTDWFSFGTASGSVNVNATGTDETTQKPVYGSYVRETDGTVYYNYPGVSLIGCTFMYPNTDAVYTQDIQNQKYFYNGYEENVHSYSSERFGQLSGNTIVPTFGQLHSNFATNFNSYVKTAYYWRDTAGVFRRVYAKSEISGRYYKMTLAYLSNGSYQYIDDMLTAIWFGAEDTEYTDVTLYSSISATTLSNDNALYLIADETGKNVLTVNTNGTVSTSDYVSSFNSQSAIAQGIWRSSGSGSAWCNFHNSNLYLNLTGSSVIGTTKDITVSNISYSGESHASALYNFRGDSYLNYGSSGFACGNASSLSIYKVTEVGTPYWNGTFSYAQMFDQRCTVTPSLNNN